MGVGRWGKTMDPASAPDDSRANMNEPEHRIENGRKIYTMDTTIGCVKRPVTSTDNSDVIPSKEGIQDGSSIKSGMTSTRRI